MVLADSHFVPRAALIDTPRTRTICYGFFDGKVAKVWIVEL
jgi:hypothetical protein